LIGCIVWIFFTACYFTKGITVMWGLLIPLFFIIFSLKNNKWNFNWKRHINFKNSIEFLCVYLLFFIYWHHLIIRENYLIPIVIHPFDYHFYANLSDYISSSGIESSNIDYINISNDKQPLPYHYFELWLNASFKWIGYSSYLRSKLICDVIFCFFIYLGIRSILEKINYKNEYWRIVLSISFLFFCGFYTIFFPSHVLIGADEMVYNLFIYPKFLPIFLIIISAILFSLYDNFKASCLVFLFLPFISILCAPAIIIGLLLLCIMNYFFDYFQFKIVIISIGISLIFLVLFYSSGILKGYGSNPMPLIHEPIDFTNAIFESSYQLGYWFYFTIWVFCPLIILILKFKRIINFLKKSKKISFLIFQTLLIFIGGFCCSTLFILDYNGNQFFSNIYFPYINIIGFCGLLFLTNNVEIKWQQWLMNIVLFIWLAKSYRYTDSLLIHRASMMPIDFPNSYIEKAKIFLHKSDSKLGVYYNSLEGGNDIFIYPIWVNKFFMNSLGEGYCVYPLDIFEINKDTGYQKPQYQKFISPIKIQKKIEKMSFYQFVELQKKQNVFKDYEQSKLDFCQQYKLGYIFVANNRQLPLIWQPFLSDSLYNLSTKEQLFLLNFDNKK